MKIPLADAELAELVRDLAGPDARVSEELTDGTFNVAYGVDLPGAGRAVLKIAPPASAPVLAYEHDLIVAELEFFDLTAHLVPAPRILARTPGSKDRPAFLMERLGGAPLYGTTLSPLHRDAVRFELGAALARLRGVRGDAFGYLRPDGSFRADSWPEAFDQMWLAIEADSQHWRVPLETERAMALVARARPALDDVDVPVLTHFDLWDGNLFVDPDVPADHAPRPGDGSTALLGVIDGERRFWGDPLAELASTSLLSDATADIALLEGFASLHDPISFTDRELLRLALYRAYLSALMIVEGAPRGYGPGRIEWVDSVVRPALAAQLEEAEARLRVLDL